MAEIYCFICGGDPKVQNVLYTELQHRYETMNHTTTQPEKPQALHPLLFSPEDVAFQTDLCLVGPLDPTNNEQLFDPVEVDPDAIGGIDMRTVCLMRGMVPAGLDDYGLILERRTGTHFAVNGNTYPFAHTACMSILFGRLVQRGYHARPDLAFWAVVREMNLDCAATTAIGGVNYGEHIGRVQAHNISGTKPLGNFFNPASGIETLRLIMKCVRVGDVPTHLSREYWLGRGAMWVHSSPVSFPVSLAAANPIQLMGFTPRMQGSSTLEQLPVELLVIIAKSLASLKDLTTLLSLSKTVRYRAGAHMDSISRALIPEWMLPPPELYPKGRYPWFRYAYTCMCSSPPMRNRRRIWNICEQIVRIADTMTMAELGQLVPPPGAHA